jgi:hypothetical protein
MKVFVAGMGALFGSALILFACTGDDPVVATTPDPLDGSGETGTSGDASLDGATIDATAPRLTCSVQNNPIPAQLGTFPFDSGNGALDDERFAMFPLGDKQSVAVAAIVKSGGSSAGAVAIWTINATQGSPSPRTVATLDVPGTRLLWVGRVSDGLGALAFGPTGGGGVGWSVYKLSDADLASPAPVTAWSSVAGPVEMLDPTFANSQGGSVLALDQNDYFIVGSVRQGSSTSSKLVTARLSPSISKLVETTLQPATLYPGSLIATPSSIHVFLSTGDFGTSFTPAHYSFDRASAAEDAAKVTLPNDLLLSSKTWSGGTALFFGDGDFAAGKADGVRIGSVTNLETLDPSKLPMVSIPLKQLGLGSGSDLRFWSDGLPQPILLAVGPRRGGPGVGFEYVDVDGTIHASQAPDGPNAFFQNVPAPSIVVATSTSVIVAPSAATATFPLAWIVRGAGADTVLYSRIICQ